MSDNELYEIARQRVDRRNRRWQLWAANILLWLVYVGVFAGFKEAIPRDIGVTIAIVWMGLVVFHGIINGMAQERSQAIDGEVERLRELIYEEKPKRLELNEDGELVDIVEDKPKRLRSDES